MFAEIIEQAAEAAARQNPKQDADYYGEDGLLYCGMCHSQKQCRVTFRGVESVVYCDCICETERLAAQKARRNQEENERRRALCFSDGKYRSARFETDDKRNAELSKLCRRYADTFTLESKWLLLYGGCGTGKTYAAAIITNALIDKGMICRFTSIHEIERQLWNNADKSTALDALCYCDLLVIDDFGAERKTEYMSEITFSVIDGRLRSGRPCLITTNLSLADFSAPTNMAEKRIVSRIFEKLIPYEVKGSDRRFENLRQSSRTALRDLLDG